MNHPSFLLFHPSDLVRTRLARALSRDGADVVQAASEQAAVDHLRQSSPTGIIAYAAAAEVDGSPLLGPRLDLPTVVLAEDRRAILRRGFTDVVGAPFDDEEVVLLMRAAVERRQGEGNLSGDLAQMSLPDLLQTSAATGRSGHIQMRRRGMSGDLWLKEGRVINAQIDDPGEGRSLAGRQAVFDMITWEDGTFTVDFGPVSLPERIHESTALLLLEGMRLWDEGQRRNRPGHAGLPDDPPPPSREKQAAHHALLLLNVTVSWMSDHLLPGLLADRLEQARGRTVGQHPLLDRLRVDSQSARVSYAPADVLPSSEEIEPWAAAVAAWLRAFAEVIDRAIPGRFSLDQLAVLTSAHHRELRELGFAAALGWPEPIDSAPVAAAPSSFADSQTRLATTSIPDPLPGTAG